MSIQLRIGKSIGQGSFGSIYEAEDEFGKVVGAMKRIPLDRSEGIPSLIEASIMASYVHPYINRTRLINVREDDLCLVQDLADSDLSVKVRYSKGGSPLDPAKLRLWAYQLLQAVNFLHEQRIVHGDIKSSNVLVFGDDLRLSDFTLSKKIWPSESKIEGRICTMIYRPLEVWIDRNYDFQADIWSLGCTFFEMAYGELLFPPQEDRDPHSSVSKDMLRSRCIDAIIEWGQRTNQNVPYKSHRTIFAPAAKVPPKYPDFNRILYRMLKLDPRERPTAKELLADPFFSGLTMKVQPKILSSARRVVPAPILTRTRTRLNKILKDPLTAELALDFFVRTYRLEMKPDRKILGCAWIASKIVRGKVFPITAPIDAMIETERRLCFHMYYRLHEVPDEPIKRSDP